MQTHRGLELYTTALREKRIVVCLHSLLCSRSQIFPLFSQVDPLSHLTLGHTHPRRLQVCTLIPICLACLNCAGDEWYLFSAGPWGSHILAVINNDDGMPESWRGWWFGEGCVDLWFGEGVLGLIHIGVWYLDFPLDRNLQPGQRATAGLLCLSRSLTGGSSEE